MPAQDRRLTHCTNCENNLEEIDAFCPNCGQKNLDRKVPFWVFTWEFIQSNLHLDARLWSTLRYFILRPGFLTVEFMEGKRKRYVYPIQLFLFMGFLCFLVVASYVDGHVSKEDLDRGNFTVLSMDDDPTSDNFIQSYFRKQKEKAEANPIFFIENTLQKIPIVLLVLLPVFALIHKVLYIRHKIYLVEHLVFLLHTHAFLFLLVLLAFVLSFLGLNSGWIPLICVLSMMVYLIIAFRTVYEQSWGKTLLKFFFLSFCYFILMPALIIFGGAIAGLIS